VRANPYGRGQTNNENLRAGMCRPKRCAANVARSVGSSVTSNHDADLFKVRPLISEASASNRVISDSKSLPDEGSIELAWDFESSAIAHQSRH
jgi:hypothetical protein